MAKNPVGFRVTNTTAGWNGTDFDDLFIRKDCFLDGGLWMWGQGDCGKFGNNSIIRRSSPVQTISGGTNWKSVSSGNYHIAGIKTDGTLWLWGSSASGQLGDNTTIGKSSPVQTVSGGTNWRVISMGATHSAAIKTDGTLWLWGSGNYGHVGNNSTIGANTPVQTISGGTNWKSISLGKSHTAATKSDGTLWAWGRGYEGSLGNNSTLYRSSPVQTISGGTNWKSVSLGSYHSTAIKTDGTLWVWGRGLYGSLANNTTIDRSSPVQTISGGTNWKEVRSSDKTSAGIKTDGTLWMWGPNTSGQLGDGTTINTSSPVQTISGGTNWRTVGAGQYHTAAIKTDGTLWAWGGGFPGQLGDNTTISKFSPVQTISGGTNWRVIGVNFRQTAAIREACW